MDIDYPKLRELVKKWEKFPGCVQIPRSPIINKGYPGSFNYSFGEGIMMEEFGGYQFFDHDFCCSATQLVIRPNDLFEIIPKNSSKHLGVFEMADVHGMITLKERKNLAEIQKEQTKNVISLLNTLGIENQRIYPKYCMGGSVKEITKGKYVFDFSIPEDINTKTALIEAGLPERNIRPDKTRDTFLALFLNRPISWGYRAEIEIDIGQEKRELLDVATLEYFLWDPVFKGDLTSKNIIGLKDITYTAALSVVGVERLYMAINGLVDIREVDYLKEFYNYLKSIDKSENLYYGEYMRALHVIFSDINYFGLRLGKHRGYYVNKMIREIPLDISDIKNLLKLHSQNQPWCKHLKDGIKSTISAIEDYKSRIVKR